MGPAGEGEMNGGAGRLLAGFLAGALAVLVFHQGMYLVLNLAGLVPNAPWRTNPVGPLAVPQIINQMFWGGLWGAAFGLALDRLPGPALVKGLIFGMVGPMLLGSWLIVATIKGQPLFSGAFAKGWDIMKLRNGFLLNGAAFGLGLGLLYPLLAGLKGRNGA